MFLNVPKKSQKLQQKVTKCSKKNSENLGGFEELGRFFWEDFRNIYEHLGTGQNVPPNRRYFRNVP